ncbi:hypothetical protein HNP84_004495 [Thermocatellispora tengchongensis]|uniref:Uncharacterized protein n=1 Tax=Thermocatellispora tengchongensis TaxID=1073253 RepID=A0A840PA76_9ACTN|nr:hypothetical protein [Thermocatellispora tengchongensis]MBB5134761.1 hypothetical protein [Thermocatellispora tengchongensis]
MKRALELAGGLLLLQGVAGLIHTLFGFWTWARPILLVNLPFLDGYEIFTAIALGVLGFALYAAADTMSGKTDD